MKMEIPQNTEYRESHIGPTPNGGAYSTAYYRDATGKPCTKDKATKVEICEYTAEGVCIKRIYGLLSKQK